MVKELLQQKELIAKTRYAERIAKNLHESKRGAQLFGNVPGLARYMPDDLKEFSINLFLVSAPLRQGMRRFTAEETQEIRKQITKMVDAGVIEACHSPLTSRVVLARKKDGTFRFVVDLRKLNTMPRPAKTCGIYRALTIA
jgi:hypothetical protein